MPHTQRPRLNYNEIATLEQLLEAELKRSRLSNPDFIKSPLNKRLKRLRRKLDRNRLKLFYKSQPKTIETPADLGPTPTKAETPSEPEPPVQFMGALAIQAPNKIQSFGLWLAYMWDSNRNIHNPISQRYRILSQNEANIWFAKFSLKN